jgi:hypothetical protein
MRRSETGPEVALGHSETGPEVAPGHSETLAEADLELALGRSP